MGIVYGIHVELREYMQLLIKCMITVSEFME